MRLSTLAASVIAAYLDTEDPAALGPYSGALFRTRFVSRLWMRRIIAGLTHPAPIELACAAMHLPIIKSFAWQVFFGRGSFSGCKGRGRVPAGNDAGLIHGT
jgi:hypothetical protein